MNEKQETTIHSVDAKLDRVIQILEGTGTDNPGILNKVRRHEEVLYGDGKNVGVVQDVASLKQIKNWAIGSLSGALGCAATLIIRKMVTGSF